jgi:hypothetical protein
MAWWLQSVSKTVENGFSNHISTQYFKQKVPFQNFYLKTLEYLYNKLRLPTLLECLPVKATV